VTTFRLLWEIHKWIGIVLGLVLMMSAVTGVLLLVKKDYHWIQPGTQRGTEGPSEKLAPIHDVYQAIFALDLPEFQSEADIDRIDFRPDKRVHKVRSIHDNLEVQVDAISCAILGDVNVRRSDWLETIHDGQFFGEFVHDYIMVIVAIATVVLAFTGYLIWLWPKILKRRARKRRAA
jgi:uncharacterized iron-regulated membrane protein